MKKRIVKTVIKTFENVMHTAEIIKLKPPKIAKTVIEMYENVHDHAEML
jgi:hypothetical protein